MSTRNSRDNDLEAEGVPDLFEAPPGQDIETDQEGMIAPGDEPGASGDYGTTAREERIDEPLYQRVRREEPEVGAADLRQADEEGEAPRLVAEDIDVNMVDDEDDAVAAESDDGGALSAEEAAVHVTTSDVADDVDPAVERREYTGDR